MSIKVMTRVWEHAEYKESTLLVLLALADYASDSGICWPSQPEIAKKARLSDRQVRNVINQLVANGEILMEPSRGRGNPARYCVLTGLTETEREKRRKEFPGNNFQENKTRKFGAEKAEIYDKKGGNQRHAKYVENEATGSGETAQPKNDNRHGTVMEPLGGERNEAPHTPAVMLYFEFYPNETLNARQIAEINRRITDLKRWRRALEYWTANSHRPQSVGKICDRYDEEATGPPGRQQNGHRPIGRAPPALSASTNALDGTLTPEETAARIKARRQ